MLDDIGKALEAEAEASTKVKVGSKIQELLDRSGIDIDDVGKIERVNVWQGFLKDDKGEPQVVDLAGIQLSPKWAEGPAWPVVAQAAPTVINPPAVRATPALLSDWKLALFMPDPQIGFRSVDGVLDPFHDDTALDLATEILAAFNHSDGVTDVCHLGDFLDLPQMGKFIQEPAYAQTAQASIDRGHRWLAEQRAAAPDARMVLVEGNHDKRLQLFVTNNAAAALGIRPANIPDSWPVLSLPYLLRLDELAVEYVDAYPAGAHWLSDTLRVIHGKRVNSGGSTAALYTKTFPGISTVFGHCHRIETHYATAIARNGPVRTFAASPGCLARTDGAVPSYYSATHLDGSAATYHENWQQGVGWAYYTDDGRHHYSSAQIFDGQTVIGGQVFGSTGSSAPTPYHDASM